MGASGQLSDGIPDILTAVSGASLRWSWRRQRRLFRRWRVVVRAYRFGHWDERGTAKRGGISGGIRSVPRPVQAGWTGREARVGFVRR